jgi:outer membrane biosynthesis protein TonB
MTKKYTAKTDIALSVYLKSGKSVHVSFSALTGGGSVLYTDDEELQAALEAHPKYGRLFKLEKTIDPKKPAKTSKTTKKAPKPAEPVKPEEDEGAEDPGTDEAPTEEAEEPVEEPADDNEEAEEEPEEDDAEADDEEAQVKKIMVNSLDEAKDYLCEHFEGYSRTKLRSKVAIKAAAEKEGFEFVGIEL